MTPTAKTIIFLLLPILIVGFLAGRLALQQAEEVEDPTFNSTSTESVIEAPAEIGPAPENQQGQANEPAKLLTAQDYEQIKIAMLEEILGEKYDIFIEGACGEVLAVKRSETLTMDDQEAVYLKWSIAAMEKAVVLKKIPTGYEAVFTVDSQAIKNSQGEPALEQVEAEYGYGFQRAQEDDYWLFDFAMLNVEGKIASELATFYWDRASCGFSFLINNQPMEL